jgi:hypothetical protein
MNKKLSNKWKPYTYKDPCRIKFWNQKVTSPTSGFCYFFGVKKWLVPNTHTDNLQVSLYISQDVFSDVLLYNDIKFFIYNHKPTSSNLESEICELQTQVMCPGLTPTSISDESMTHTDKYLWWVQYSHRQVSPMSPVLTQTSISDESRTHTDKYLWWIQDSHRQVSLMSPGLTQTSISDESRTHTDKYLWWVQDSHRQVSLHI